MLDTRKPDSEPAPSGGGSKMRELRIAVIEGLKTQIAIAEKILREQEMLLKEEGAKV